MLPCQLHYVFLLIDGCETTCAGHLANPQLRLNLVGPQLAVLSSQLMILQHHTGSILWHALMQQQKTAHSLLASDLAQGHQQPVSFRPEISPAGLWHLLGTWSLLCTCPICDDSLSITRQ